MASEETSQRVLVPVCRVLKMLVFTLLLGSSHAEDFQVVGSPQTIVAVVGDDVILPCQVVPDKDVSRFTVEWSKPDLRPHPQDRLSRVELVHLYRNSREVQEMKLQSYVQRTALFADGLRRGNISLKISNVTLEDKGRYKCLIPKLNSVKPYSIIHLDVVAESKVWTTETPLPTESLQTPQPTQETESKGDLSTTTTITIIAVTTSVMLLIVLTAVGLYLAKRLQQRKHLETPAAWCQQKCERDPL